MGWPFWGLPLPLIKYTKGTVPFVYFLLKLFAKKYLEESDIFCTIVAQEIQDNKRDMATQ